MSQNAQGSPMLFKAGTGKQANAMQMRQVFQNPETGTALNQDALRFCQNNQIDYKELLPKNNTDQDMIGLSDAQVEVRVRQHELRRHRRIIQVAKLLTEGGLQLKSPGKGKHQNSNRVLDLSLSNEEKILRTTYGNNFEAQMNMLSPNRGHPQGHRRNNSIGQTGKMQQKSQPALTVFQQEGANINTTGGLSFAHLTNPSAMQQRQDDKKVKWNSVIKNKEEALQSRHKRMKEQIAKQVKYDKAKAKQQKESEANRKFLIDKQNERATQNQHRKKANDRDLNDRMQDTDQKVKVKLQAAEMNRTKQLEELRNKNAGLGSINNDGYDDDSRDNSSIAKRINMSKSQNLRGQYNQYTSEPHAQLYNIERKIHKANERKQLLIGGTLDKQHVQLTKVEQTITNKDEMSEKRQFDVMNKVVLKHHNKMIKFKKDEKKERDLKAYNIEKTKESELMLKNKLKDIDQQRAAKMSQLKQKFVQLDKSKIQLDSSKLEYMNAKRETHMFKFLDQGENMQRVKRGQSAYKRHLVDKILEKGNRARDVSERRYRVSEMAIQNSQQLRTQFQHGIENLAEIDRNQKMDLNHKNIYQNIK